MTTADLLLPLGSVSPPQGHPSICLLRCCWFSQASEPSCSVRKHYYHPLQGSFSAVTEGLCCSRLVFSCHLPQREWCKLGSNAFQIKNIWERASCKFCVQFLIAVYFFIVSSRNWGAGSMSEWQAREVARDWRMLRIRSLVKLLIYVRIMMLP